MINGAKLAFLESVLGVGGAAALSKAVSKAPSIENILLPRTIISWLTIAGQIQYNGSIPGINDSRMSLTKTDSGWDGSIEISGVEYQLDSADLCKVGAHIAVAIGADEGIDSSVKTVDIAKLGKTIDLLIKARVVNSLAKGWPKDEKENQENAEAHAVLSDLAEEKGKVVGVPSQPIQRTNGMYQGSFRGVLDDSPPGPGEWSWNISKTKGTLGRDIPNTRYSISGTGNHSGVKEGRPSWTPGLPWEVTVREWVPGPGPEDVSYRHPMTFAAASHQHVRAIGDALAEHLKARKTLVSFDPKKIPAPEANESDEYEAKFGTKKAESSGRGAHERAGTPETLKPDGPIPQAGPTKQQGIPKQHMPKATGANPAGPVAKSERSAKISRAQSLRKCHVCGNTHFSDGHFVGCKCLTNLAKNISSVPDNRGGFVVTMQSMDLEDVIFVLDALRGE